jgi:predicted RNA-binding protein with PIN domain
MPYIIDGHNLIPKIPGQSLSDIDDEMHLVEILQEFCRNSGKKVEVYFDNAPTGGKRVWRFGAVTAYFVRQGITADAAISNKLSRLGRSAKNFTVVSSDRAVIAAGKSARAQVMTSEQFAGLLTQNAQVDKLEDDENPLTSLGPDEIDEWLELFNDGKSNN